MAKKILFFLVYLLFALYYINFAFEFVKIPGLDEIVLKGINLVAGFLLLAGAINYLRVSRKRLRIQPGERDIYKKGN